MKIVFTATEVKEILIAAVVLSVAFAIANFGGIFDAIHNLDTLPTFVIYSFIAVGIGFLAHELIGHKIVAQHLGMHGEFRMWRFGIIIAFLSSLVGFVFAAPGAVYVGPKVDIWGRAAPVSNRRMGAISLAGPLVNVALAIAFYVLYLFSVGQISDMSSVAVTINVWLALFNMLPIPPLDGSKVLRWDRRIWGAVFIGILAMFLIL
jgi:Zn-dependent protease